MSSTTLPNPYKTKTTQTRAYQYFSVQRAKFNVQRKTFKKSTLNVARRTLNEYYFTYSPEGNLTSKARYKANASLDTLTGYVYNYQNQLKNVKDFREIIITYGYDPQGQRIYAQTPSGTKFYLWDLGGRIISEGTPQNDYIVRYIYSGNEKIAMIRNNQIYYFINNAQGTPAIIMDSNGKIISRQQMDEYGNLEQGIIGPAGAKNEVNFTGKKLDSETGLIYFNQRYYDPELGRFLQEDPMGQGPTPYTYCANNPLMYTDPDGQLFGIDDWIIGAIIGAVITGCGKDLKNPDTWFDIAIGATAGAFGGVFVDTLASEGAVNWLATVANEEGAMAMLGGGAVKWAMGDNGSGGGYIININDGIGIWDYMHMNPDKIAVSPGQYVMKSQYLGDYDYRRNGETSGPHTHVQYRVGGATVNPGNIFPLNPNLGNAHISSPYHNYRGINPRTGKPKYHGGIDFNYGW